VTGELALTLVIRDINDVPTGVQQACTAIEEPLWYRMLSTAVGPLLGAFIAVGVFLTQFAITQKQVHRKERLRVAGQLWQLLDALAQLVSVGKSSSSDIPKWLVDPSAPGWDRQMCESPFMEIIQELKTLHQNLVAEHLGRDAYLRRLGELQAQLRRQ
jgi:hypothetical protein